MNALPCACYKGRLYERLNDVSLRHLKDELNNTIAKLRGVSLEEAKKIKKITKKECEQVMADFGEL